MKILSFIRSLFSRNPKKEEARHIVKLPDGGEAELVNPNYQRRGYALLERNGKQLIRRPDGSFVSLGGETDFLFAVPSVNGTVIVSLD